MENSRLPYVSIVVPARNAESLIKDCIISLLSMNYPPDRREILIVDNNSRDRTSEIIKELPVRYLFEPNRGVSFARNMGIRNSTGEIIAFCDADCVVSRKWLWELIISFNDPGAGGIAGEIVPFLPKTPAERYAARIRHLSPEKYLSRPHLPFAVFANLAFRREVFDRIGLLDETFSNAGESTDFCTRFFRETDLKLVYAPRALVFHRHRMSTRSFFRQQWNYGRSHALLYIKYRNEISWGWRQSALAYRDLMASAVKLIKYKFALGFDNHDDINYFYFEFLKKVAERLGFVRESIARGYIHL